MPGSSASHKYIQYIKRQLTIVDQGEQEKKTTALNTYLNRIVIVSKIVVDRFVMVRNYARKTPKPSYTENDIAIAIEKICAKEWTYEKASSITNIPIGTLASRISRKSSQQVGRPTSLTMTEEKHLVDLILTLQDYGELSTCNDILRYASEFVDIMGLKQRFKHGEPTRDWYYGFLKRWKHKLKIMNSTKLEKARADVTASTVDGWFAKLHSVLTKLDLFNKPQQLFNCDESGFRDDPGKKKVVVSRDTKYANKIHSGSGKDSTTVLLTISASGVCFPPYIIYKSKCLYDTWCPRNVIRGTVYNKTESGWINEDTFYDYLKTMFIQQTKDIPKPILLIFDGHTSHLSLKSVRLAIENQIHLLCLPAHATHLLQPLDVYTLKYVKAQWRTLLWDYSKRNSGRALDKSNFVRLYAQLYQYALLPAHCSAAFGKAGIFPYDPRVIKHDKLVKTSLGSTTSKTITRSVSVEYDYHENGTSITACTSTLSSSNQTCRLVKYPSDPILPLSQNDCNVTRQLKKPSKTRESAINALDDALYTCNSILSSTLSSSIEVISTGVPSSNNYNFASSSTINNSLASSMQNLNENSSTSSSACNDSLNLTAQNMNHQPISLQSNENDRCLNAIQQIVKKHFSQPSVTVRGRKKRLVSRENGRSITDLDELALATIKKKRITGKRNIKKKITKTVVPEVQDPLSTTDTLNADRPHATNVNSVHAAANSSMLPPIAYMMPASAAPVLSTCQSSVQAFATLDNFSQIGHLQCQLCFSFIQQLETASNCTQCHRILCWECSSKLDTTYQLCLSCRMNYINHQQAYFARDQL